MALVSRSPELAPETLAHVRRLGHVDVLVGVPSFQSERTIGHVVRAVVAGLAKHFPDARAVLVNSDGGSTDRTRDIVLGTEVGDLPEILVGPPRSRSIIERVVTPYTGLPGKGSALRTVFRIAAELEATACAVVDADLRSITPDWIHLLIEPVLSRGYEFVSPLYARHPFDGTITNTIVYPLTRSLYGQRIRQPIGGDFGFSGGMAARFLDHTGWDGPVAQYGIDIFMTTTAVAEGHRVAQAFLGAKIHDPKDPGADLGPMLRQVVSTLLEMMQLYEGRWRDVRGSQPVPLFGFPYAVGLENVPVKLERLAEAFRRATSELPPVWELFLSPGTLGSVLEAARAPVPQLPDEVWVDIVHETAAADRWRRLPRASLASALLPLYLGKVATFVSEVKDAPPGEAEDRLSALAETFEKRKDRLIALWDGKAPESGVPSTPP